MTPAVPRAPVAFQLAHAHPLSLPAHAGDDVLWDALCHRILRRPNVLSEHVRRISLCRRVSMQHHAGAALADLLHVLDGGGRPLAMRQLAAVLDLLDETERRVLGRWAALGHRPQSGKDRARLESLSGRLMPVFAPARLRTHRRSATDAVS